MNWIKGKSYKTVGGHEVVFIKEDAFYLYFTHVEDCETYEYGKDGVARGLDSKYTVTTEEWKEPRKGEVWVNVYDDGTVAATNPEIDKLPEANCKKKLARIRVNWQEGVFDE